MRGSPFVGKERPGAVEMGEGAAAVDVGDEDYRGVSLDGDAHVGQVAIPEIDFGGTPGAFDEDELGAPRGGIRGIR